MGLKVAAGIGVTIMSGLGKVGQSIVREGAYHGKNVAVLVSRPMLYLWVTPEPKEKNKKHTSCESCLRRAKLMHEQGMLEAFVNEQMGGRSGGGRDE